MKKGCVWLEQDGGTRRLRRAKKQLSKDAKNANGGVREAKEAKEVMLHCYYDENILAAEPLPARLVSDQGDYSIWDKPCGMFSQGSKWGDHCTIYRWAEMHLSPERPAFLVHRLDRAASGLILLAHKKQTAAQFAAMFRQRQIEKWYRVLVSGDFSSILKKGKADKTISHELDCKPAKSQVHFVSYDETLDQSVLEIQIVTGRKHQIRRHLSALGFPVVGDRLYKIAGHEIRPQDLQLRAIRLAFNCPVSGEKKMFTVQA